MADAVKEVRDLRAEVARLRERVDAADGARLAASWPRIVPGRGVSADRVDNALVLSRPVPPMPEYRYYRHEINMSFTALEEGDFDDASARYVLWDWSSSIARRMLGGGYGNVKDFNGAADGSRTLLASRPFLTMQPVDDPPMSFRDGNLALYSRRDDGFVRRLIFAYLWQDGAQHDGGFDIDYYGGVLGLGIRLNTLASFSRVCLVTAPPAVDMITGIDWFRPDGNGPLIEIRTDWSFRELVDASGNPREPTQDDFDGDIARYVFWGMGPPENPQEPEPASTTT